MSLIQRRERALAPSYQLFYDEPINLVRGKDVWVFDNEGRRYLDCYNNVPSVGHCHPRVVAAITEQVATLNTHTRYLHEGVVRLAERLGHKLGGNLSACWLVCSGTEANDLAIEVARTVTGHHGVIVTEDSYHGNSSLVRLLSTEIYPRADRPDWLEVIEAPNIYRGPHLANEPEVGRLYADMVSVATERLTERGFGTAALLVDSSWDSNGVLIAPDDYLNLAAGHVHSAGGLVISDEVQSGYCRLGDYWWGHQKYALVPDMVTMGKPMGAGHPVAACVTTPSIAERFADRRSYFNTFGGNPVSAAAANAVIDVIDDEQLLTNVTVTGHLLEKGLHELAERHPIIGNVQGSGLFYGLDLVSDPDTKQPLSADDTRGIVTDLKRSGLLTGVTGPSNNVLKIRPPLTFNADHATTALETINAALASRI